PSGESGQSGSPAMVATTAGGSVSPADITSVAVGSTTVVGSGVSTCLDGVAVAGSAATACAGVASDAVGELGAVGVDGLSSNAWSSLSPSRVKTKKAPATAITTKARTMASRNPEFDSFGTPGATGLA